MFSAALKRVLSKHLLGLAVLCAAFAVGTPAGAVSPLDAPDSSVILSLDGQIARTNAPGRADFDMHMLAALPQAHIETHTPWTEGVTRFDGVLVRDLLKHVAANGQELAFTALNDYAVSIGVTDFDAYPVLIATKMNGAPMSVRNKGPLWLIYPMDDYPELQEPLYRDRMIWQLRSITVK